MTGVYLIPIGNSWVEDFSNTVLSSVSVEGDEFDMENGRYWGTNKSRSKQKETHFEMLSSGDFLLFYLKGIYVGVGTCGRTYDHPDFAEFLWDTRDSRWIYSVENFKRMYVDKTVVAEALGMSVKYYPHGFSRVTDQRAKELVERYGSVESFIEEVNQYEAHEHEYNELFRPSETDD